MSRQDRDFQEYVNKIGANVAFYRKQKNLTQRELAQKTGIGLQTLSCIECGINNLTLKTAIKISKALDVPLSYFYTFDEEEFTIKDKELQFMAVQAFKLLDYNKRKIAFELVKCFRQKSRKTDFGDK